MKTVGHRRQPELHAHASGEALAAGARFSESIAHLAGSTFIPKGVYRFRTHEAANKHQEECLARGMARLAAERARARGA
jgi:hypothetical protein